MQTDSMDIEALLKESLDRHLFRKGGSPGENTPANLAESISYSLLAPGKRIRPRLLITCAEMLGIPAQAAVPAALSLEMIHCFTLIHDDLPCMDDDDFRRGMPSNHKKFGETIALLAGDALMALASEVFLDTPLEAKNVLAGLKKLLWASGPRAVIGGQAAESLLGSHSNLDDLRHMHAQKTGALFSAAILIPKEFAGISDDSDQGKALGSFAYELGLAFQVADDLEDALVDGKEVATHEPTSILFYLPKEEAAQITRRNLIAATESIENAWQEKSKGLKRLSDEVVRKIDTALEMLKK